MACTCPTCGQPLPEGEMDEIKVDPDTRTIIRGDQACTFTRTHMKIFLALWNRRRRTTRWDTLIGEVWPIEEPEGAIRSLQVHITKMRRQLDGLGIDIRSIYGEGLCIATDRIMPRPAKDGRPSVLRIVA